MGTARALARVYGELSSGGRELELERATLDALMAPAVPSWNGFFDECLRAEVPFSLGFMKPNPGFEFGSAGAFGAPGAGGALGYADPESGIGYGYVTNRMGTHFAADPRDVALRAALAQCPLLR